MNEEFQAEKRAGAKGIVDYDTLSLEFMKLDLNYFKSVVEFCEEYKRSGRPLHVLFCCAGIAGQKYGKEFQYGIIPVFFVPDDNQNYLYLHMADCVIYNKRQNAMLFSAYYSLFFKKCI